MFLCLTRNQRFLSLSLSQCVCMGILLGSATQKIAAVANLIGYYCVGLPLGISLMFAAKLGVVGKSFFLDIQLNKILAFD